MAEAESCVYMKRRPKMRNEKLPRLYPRLMTCVEAVSCMR
jgi:hypothetical protein